jgi:hypothetical protein
MAQVASRADVRNVRFALTGDATLRMSLQGAGRPIYIYGACNWYQGDLNRGVQDNILDRRSSHYRRRLPRG